MKMKDEKKRKNKNYENRFVARLKIVGVCGVYVYVFKFIEI